MWHTLRLILHVFLVFQIYSLLDVSNWGSRFSTKYFIMFTCMQSPVSISTYYWCNGPFLYFFANGCTRTLFLGLLRQIIFENTSYCLLFLQVVALDNFFANWSTRALCLQILLSIPLFLQVVVLDPFFLQLFLWSIWLQRTPQLVC